MNSNEVMQLLAVVSQYQYVNLSDVDSAKVTVFAWSEAMDDDLPLQLAIATVTRYYGEPSWEKRPPITPGMLNAAWQDVKHKEAEKRQRAIASGAVEDERPMPDWFKAAMQEAWGHGDLSKSGTPAPGTRTRSKGEVQAIFDRHAAAAGIDLAQVRRELDGAA